MVRVNSPGGTITGSDYMLHYLRKLAEDTHIPIVVSMGGLAASGGYYVSMCVGDTPETHLRRADHLDRLDRRDHSALQRRRTDGEMGHPGGRHRQRSV